jgi:hypothetical protein
MLLHQARDQPKQKQQHAIPHQSTIGISHNDLPFEMRLTMLRPDRGQRHIEGFVELNPARLCACRVRLPSSLNPVTADQGQHRQPGFVPWHFSLRGPTKPCGKSGEELAAYFVTSRINGSYRED